MTPDKQLSDWISRAHYIDRTRSSARRYERLAEHWASLDIQWIKAANSTATLGELDRTIEFAMREKPRRGHRRGTKWELVNMAIKNRAFMLRRLADEASMGTGHNSRHRQLASAHALD